MRQIQSHNALARGLLQFEQTGVFQMFTQYHAEKRRFGRVFCVELGCLQAAVLGVGAEQQPVLFALAIKTQQHGILVGLIDFGQLGAD